MNDHKEHISQYSAADIQAYVQGKLSAAEMHAMEKAALDDPFLADAIEGMQQAFDEHKESLITGQLQQLQQDFQARTAGKAKVVAFKPFRYWQAAAAAVIILIIGVWMFTLVKNKANVTGNDTAVIAKTEKQEPQQQAPAPSLADGKEITINTDSVLPPETAPNANNSYRNKKEVTAKAAAPAASEQQFSNLTKNNYSHNAETEAKKAVMDNPDRYFAKPEKKETLDDTNMAAAPSAAAATPVVTKSLKNDNEILREKEAETELITIAKPDSYKRKAVTKDKNLSGFIKGQVTDPFHNPVANAYVQIQKNNNNNNFLNNFTTDKSGYFKIPVSDSVVNVAVNVSGYGTQNFTLENNVGLNQLQLQPANYAANYYSPAAPVNGKKQLANSYKFPNVMVYEAEPAYGWVAFGQYLEKNKVIPAGADNISGNVVVSFEVNKKGDLSNYKIEQSLSKIHDEEAIRLIKQGPSWKLRSGRKARVTVMVKF
jgi:TonB family protein